MTASAPVNPVDQILPVRQLFVFGLQHVLVMYAGTVAVPLILGSALGLTSAQLVALINADLLTCGLATLLQTLGWWRFGARLPLIQGCSFVCVGPMILIGRDAGMPAIYGAVIGAGLITILVAPLFSRLLRFFPPVVIGTVITLIGLSLMPVAGRWLGGGDPTASDFGAGGHLALGLATVTLTLAIYAFTRGFVRNLSVLLGLIGGTAIAAGFGGVDFSIVGESSWFDVSRPFLFGPPQFSLGPTLLLAGAMLVVMTETTGNCLAIGRMVGRPTTRRTLADALRADGLSTMLGGVFNSFPYNAFAQNTGLITLSQVKSRFVVTAAGALLVFMGLFPKLGAIIACVPRPVLGGAAIVMFGMTTVAGIQELARVPFEGTRNAIIVAVALSLGLLPMATPALFGQVHGPLQLFLENGIMLGGVAALVLNLLLNGATPADTVEGAHEN